MKNTGALLIASLIVISLQGCQKYKFYFLSSGSMLPTIPIKNRVMVDVTSYDSNNPQREDLVIYLPTQQLQKEGFESPFIGRVVGLSGEKVELKNGQVYINSKPLQEDYVMTKNKTFIDVCSSKYEPLLSSPVQIPPYSYLILGDNRENSYDSRCWGVVPQNNLIGKIVTILNF